MEFQQKGLFVGLISFPYDIKGDKFFNKIITPLFNSHREYLKSCCGEFDLSNSLYKPHAYRMFGRFGLAVISLIDDFGFGARIFDSGHLDWDDDVKVEELENLCRFKSVVLLGTSDKEQQKYPFMKEKERFPFFGIIRLKVDNAFLRKSEDNPQETSGIYRIERIKQQIKGIMGQDSQGALESIVIDTYDDDEFAVLIFANSLSRISSCFREIRQLKASLASKDKYVFISCYSSYGYDKDFEFSSNKQEKFNTWNNAETEGSEWKVNFLIEPRPGYRDLLKPILQDNNLPFKKLEEKGYPCQYKETEGTCFHCQCEIKNIIEAEKLYKHIEYINRIKLSLSRKALNNVDDTGNNCTQIEKGGRNLISIDKSNKIRKLLIQAGVSKILRGKILALIDLFNDCAQKELHRSYLERLKSSILRLEEIINPYINEVGNLAQLEEFLSNEISSLEMAIYNGIHNNVHPNIDLEYNAGVQQFLISFNYAYNKVLEVIDPKAPSCYTCISGFPKVHSTRTHLMLNINHIIFPQLFCTTIWKEASNFRLEYEKQSEDNKDDELIKMKDLFVKFVNSESTYCKLRDCLHESLGILEDNSLYWNVYECIDKSLINYIVSDFYVFHFAFQRDFEKMWYFYWKSFLQTSTYNNGLELADRHSFIFTMLRLMTVGMCIATDNHEQNITKFISENRRIIFDYKVASLWTECYDPLLAFCENIKDILESYLVSSYCEACINELELTLADSYTNEEKKKLEDCFKQNNSEWDELASRTMIDYRKDAIDKLKDSFMEGKFNEKIVNEGRTDLIVCIISAYISAAYELSAIADNPLKSVPRREDDGEIDFDSMRSDGNTIWSEPVLSDPVGGMLFVDQKIRQKFFAMNTAFYRTLWHLSYTHKI